MANWKPSPQQDAMISKLCRTLAKEGIVKIAQVIDGLPVPEQHKQSMLLTVYTTMLNDTLNSFYEDHMDNDGLLKKKLAFVRIVREAFIAEHKLRAKQEKDNDTQ